MWTWIAVVVLGLIILGAAAAPLLGKLDGLRRALVRLQRRQAEAMRLQEDAVELERTVAEIQARVETIAQRR